MATESYRNAFLDRLGDGSDPHDCWQPDGFWPNRCTADLQDLHVWAWTVSEKYLTSVGLVPYLDFISGRTLPEMIVGFTVLNCPSCVHVASEISKCFGHKFPRDEESRTIKIAENRGRLYTHEKSLFDAMHADKLTVAAEAYYRVYCESRQIQPLIDEN